MKREPAPWPAWLLRWLAHWQVATLCWLAPPALAQPPPVLIREAEQAERNADPARALRLYRDVVAGDETGRLARRAERRIEYLEARDVLGFGPLETMLTTRMDPTPERLVALEEAMLEWPPGLVRREGWQLLAERRLAAGETGEAIRCFRAWMNEPDIPEAERRLATTGLARALGDEGRAAEGIELLERSALGDSRVAETLALRARTPRREGIAWAVLALFLLLALGVGRRALVDRAAWRRAWSPRRALGVAYVVGVPWLVATTYDASALDSFGWLALGERSGAGGERDRR